MRRTKTLGLFTSCAAAALPLAPAVVEASGFALLEQSASRLGSAFSGTAAIADDATTVYFNVAGMTQLKSVEAIAIASGIEITSELTNTSSTAAFGQPLGGNGGDAGDWNFVPSAYLAAPVTDKLALGIAVNAPFGLKLEYEDGWSGRFQALNSEIKTINFNPSAAYRISEQFSVGAGVSYQRLEAELTSAVNYSAIVAAGVQQLVAAGRLPLGAAPGVIAANVGLEGDTRVRGDDEAWGFNVGLLFDLSDSTRLGLSYRSSIEYTVRGTVNFSPPTSSNPIGAGIITAVSASGAQFSSGPVSVELEVPDNAIFSVRQRVGDKLELMADIAWTGWSSVQELRVVRDTGAVVSLTPEKWEDVYRYAIGAAYALNDRFTLRAGIAYDETPVPDETRTPRLPDPDRTWTAIGLRYQPSPPLIIDFGYAHLFSDDVPIDQDNGNALAFGRITGDQGSDIDIVAMQLIYRF
jgi:long-chain fatty acid transport protein